MRVLDKKLNITVASYADDIACRGSLANVELFMKMLGERFQCKEVQWLGADEPLDHLGMVFFENEKGHLPLHAKLHRGDADQARDARRARS